MPRKLFIWNGHPRDRSLSHGLADAYEAGAREAGAESRRMDLFDMEFRSDLTWGYMKELELEPCLREWQDNIKWADRLLICFPYWWGGMPAKMKAVLDRAFLPGFAMNYHDDDPFWDKLLKGRRADVYITANAPGWFDWLVWGCPGRREIKHSVLEFSGIKVNRMRHLAPAQKVSDRKIQSWLDRARRDGMRAGA